MIAATVTSEKLKHFEARDWPKTLPEQNGLQDAVHAPDLAERDRYILALIEAKEECIRNLARRMATCADSVHLFFDADDGTANEYLHRCKARLCPLCARARSNHVSRQVEEQVREMKSPRHLVLTVKSRDVGLTTQLRDLRGWFAKLRRTPFWQKHVTRGVYTVEVTINERTGLWHPHIHCVFEGQYLPYKIVQRLWHEITGGSEIIWLAPVDNAQGMARELCKYIGKPQQAEHWTDENIRTYALAIRGSRMMQSFGKARPKPILDLTPEMLAPTGTKSISLARILWLAEMCQEEAYRALPLIAERWPHLGRYIYNRMPQLEPDGTKAERILRIMAIIETGRAPPRHGPGPHREDRIIEAELTPHLVKLHDLKEEDIWSQ